MGETKILETTFLRKTFQIIGRKKSHNKATHNSIGHYLRNSLFLMVLG